MAKKQQPEISYCPREELDAELDSAINDILSAEEEAKRIIADAEAAVKELRAQNSAQERELREKANAELAAARDQAIADATARAVADCESRMREAHGSSDKLVEEKRDLIKAQIAKLYSSLGGKK